MFPRALLAATLAAVCIYEVCDAIPSTSLRRTHTLRASNSGLDFLGQRRARYTQTTSPSLGPYVANYSLVGQGVECSDAAKRCLAVNKLLYEPWGVCYQLGDTLPCGGESNGSVLILDQESYRRGTLLSKCSESHSCIHAKMAYDGKCYKWSDVRNVICDGIRNVVFHPLGGYECQITEQLSDRVKVIRQPNSPGRCVVPNLQNNVIKPFWVECSTAEEECLKQNLLPFRGSCHAPFSETSCPEGQWLVLDEEAAETGRLIAKCKSLRPCGSDAQLLRADRACHANSELIEKLCVGEYIFPLPTGDYICTAGKQRGKLFGLRRENGLCEVRMLESLIESILVSAVRVQGPKCVMNHENVCQNSVSSPIAKPDLSPED